MSPVFKKGLQIIIALMHISNKHPTISRTPLALTTVLYKVSIWPQKPRTKGKKKEQKKKNAVHTGSTEPLEPEATNHVVLEIISNHLWQKIKRLRPFLS